MNNITIDPEAKKIKDEIESLRKEFITLYTEKDELLSVDKDDLSIKYIKLIGQAKYENFCLSVEVKSLIMKTELAQAAVNRNEKPDIHEIEKKVNAQLQEYRKMIDEQAEALKEAQEASMISKFDLVEAHVLYRTLVKRLHPDLHPNQPDKMTDLFIKGQTAYKMHDIGMLREIVMRLDIDGDVDDLLLKSDKSLEEIRDGLQTQINEIKHDIDAIESSFPFNMKECLEDAKWIREQQDELKKEREQLEEQKKIYTERFSLLTDL
jgi:hypothetical protein